MSNILVFSATGTIGSAVADAFKEAGHNVVRASPSPTPNIVGTLSLWRVLIRRSET